MMNHGSQLYDGEFYFVLISVRSLDESRLLF